MKPILSQLLKPTDTDIIQIGELADNAFRRFGSAGLYRKMFTEVSRYWQIFPTCVIRDEDNKILAFASLETPEFSFAVTDNYGYGPALKFYILGIASDENHRRKGFGRMMMQWLLDTSVKLAKFQVFTEPDSSFFNSDIKPKFQIWLTAAPDNEAAIPLFKSFGFKFCSECDSIGEYETGVEARYMYKNLDSLVF